MQTPKRKPPKYAGQARDSRITVEKYKELKGELERLKKHKRPPAIKEVKRLALLGDFSENAAYQIAKGRLRGINRAIDEIEDLISKAEIIEKNPDTEKVDLGHTVIIEAEGKEKNYKILGGAETAPNKGVISADSPLGSALLGKKIGQEINFKTATGKIKKYKIIKII